MQIDKTDAKTRGFGDFGITILDDVMVAMSDGIKLSAKFWFPSTKASSLIQNARKSRVYFKPDREATEETFATIVEYLPYRKNDYTAERDQLRHPWMASHGYVIMRVDMRGSGPLVSVHVMVCNILGDNRGFTVAGDSEGLYHGEYLEQEQLDCLEVFSWIEKQSWSNGKVSTSL